MYSPDIVGTGSGSTHKLENKAKLKTYIIIQRQELCSPDIEVVDSDTAMITYYV